MSTTVMRPPDVPRVDSPLIFSPSTVTDYCTSSPQDPALSANITPEHVKRKRRPVEKTRTTKPASQTTSLRFFVVDHPTQLKDKKALKLNRKHVMQDYLDKERRKPDSTDARVTGNMAGKKRKRLDAQSHGTSLNPAFPVTIFASRQSPISQDQGSVAPGQTLLIGPPAKQGHRQNEANAITRQRPVVFADDLSPLVHYNTSGRWDYLSTALDTVPDPTAPIGSNLNPFDTWPKPARTAINVEQLKWICSRDFGTQGITTHWIPTLLKAKHAFLSTLCISSSHDDIMQRGAQERHQRLPFGSSQRWLVRGEVLSMINSAMQDPELRATDATIVAVLQLLNSEIMGCDGPGMAIHQRGLHNLIKERGGLRRLGVDGQLSSILTITMYLISALRESEPHSDFVRYTEEKDTRPPHDQRQLPESPAYCRPSGYITILRVIPPHSPILELLDGLRLLTNGFIKESTPSLSQSPDPHSTVEVFYSKIWTTPSANDRGHDFSETRDRDRFEALRLVAQVYSHALRHHIPISTAASHLSPDGGSASYHILIKQVLLRTDLSECWGHLGGVLFWITLVAGACGNPDASANQGHWDVNSEEEEARKWLAAVAVRCSIVLSFEYGGAILQTLKVVVGIEQALARFEAEREGREVRKISVGEVQPVTEDGRYGPAEAPLPQRTFQDFANDFLGDA